MEEEEPDMDEGPQQTEDDGDDELLTNDEEERASERTTRGNKAPGKENQLRRSREDSEEEYFRIPMAVRPRSSPLSRTPARTVSPPLSGIVPLPDFSPSKRQLRQKPAHNRNLSTNTVLFSPTKDAAEESSRSSDHPPRTAHRSGTTTPGRPLASRSGTATPGKLRPTVNIIPATRPRPVMPPPSRSPQHPNLANFIALNQRQREPSFNALALDLASDIGDNRPQANAFGGLPLSLNTQLEMASRMRSRKSGSDEESTRMNRIIMARMTNMEEGFRDVLKELKGLKKSTAGSDGTRSPPPELVKRKGKGKKKSIRSTDITEEERMGSSL